MNRGLLCGGGAPSKTSRPCTSLILDEEIGQPKMFGFFTAAGMYVDVSVGRVGRSSLRPY